VTTPDDAVVELTSALIAIDSVSPSLAPGADGERAIVEFLTARLDAAGFAVESIPAPSDPRRVSLLAVRHGSRAGRTVVLNGHLDTVGVEGMPSPFTPRIEGDRLSGRGASDMKGGVAGLVVAAERLAAADAPGTLVVALVADEEDASLGAEAVLAGLDARGLDPDLCLIAEPTWLDLVDAHRGYAVVDVQLRGRAAHSSQPEEAVDAVRGMGELLAAVAAADADLTRRAPHPSALRGSLMVTVARAGTAPFTVAAAADVVVERRTVPGEGPADALDEVRALVEPILARTPGLGADIALTIARDAWELDESGAAAEFAGLLRDALAATGWIAETRGAPYWMESALWQAAGVPTVVCGPAGGGLHAVDEWVDLAQLGRFPVAVADAVARFLEVPA
jgi:acetylornithine deacetylase